MRGMGFIRIFGQEKEATIAMGLFFIGSIVSRLLLAGLYQGLIRGTDNLAITENRQLKQCKLKFAHCYQLNRGVANIPVFVDKFISRLSIGPFSYDFFYHLSGQLILLSIVALSVGVCRSLIRGRSLIDIFPFYIAAFMELYVYFSVSALTDIRGKRRKLKINLVDYLENHLISRYPVTAQDMKLLYGRESRLPTVDATGERKNRNRSVQRKTECEGMQKDIAGGQENGAGDDMELKAWEEDACGNAGSFRKKRRGEGREKREETRERTEETKERREGTKERREGTRERTEEIRKETEEASVATTEKTESMGIKRKENKVRNTEGEEKEGSRTEEKKKIEEKQKDKELEELLTDFLYFS